ncbi:carboxylesterase [Sphingomonas sp. DBB INV C78]|uniref:alpha/beta hydrolase n=1 Tax=Sphingomonas sp. DBB INV C78 TaxID=3349434 RepID=UPI0036D215FD
MMRRLLGLGAAGVLAALVAIGCSPVGTFNALVPKDGGVAQLASAIPYGEGPRRKLDIYAPKAVAKEPRPVIVFFYGGSWNSGTRRSYGFAARALAAQGFVVVVPDYRLVPEVLFPGFLEDGAAAVRWVRANAGRYGGDGERILLVGHSAGAYNAAMLALDPRWLGSDRAAIRGFAGLAGPYDFAPFDTPVSIATFGKWPDAADTQPIHFVDAGDPAALLLHGGDDETVRPSNSTSLAAALTTAGVPVEIKLYPGIGHVGIAAAIARPFRGKAPTLADVTAFARKVTAGATDKPAHPGD